MCIRDRCVCVCVSYLQSLWAEELQKMIGALVAISLRLIISLSTLLTDMELWDFLFMNKTKADSMLPLTAHTTEHHQTIILT